VAEGTTESVMAGTLPRNSDKALVVPYYVRACALGISAYLIGIHLWTWVFNVRYFLAGRADFRAMYVAGYLVRTGQRDRLYDFGLQSRLQDSIVGPSNTPLPFNHLSYESLLFAPLSLFTYRTAYLIFLGLNLCLLGACFGMFRSWTQNLSEIYPWFPVALFAGYLPIAAALIQGQDSILLLTIFAGSFLLVERNQDAWAGVLLGLTIFKFQLALPIALMFLLWKNWGLLTGFVVTSTLVLCGSVWLVGPAGIRTYIHLLLTMSNTITPEYLRNVASPNQMPNLRGLMFGLANHRIPASFVQIITVSLSAAVLFWGTCRSGLRRGLVGFLAAITIATLVSYHLNIHDLSVMFLPIVCVLDRFVQSEGNGQTMDKWLARSAALAFCAPVAESFFPEHLYLASVPVFIFLAILLRHPVATGMPVPPPET
jgi:Glycosyltransferase family 87